MRNSVPFDPVIVLLSETASFVLSYSACPIVERWEIVIGEPFVAGTLVMGENILHPVASSHV